MLATLAEVRETTCIRLMLCYDCFVGVAYFVAVLLMTGTTSLCCVLFLHVA